MPDTIMKTRPIMFARQFVPKIMDGTKTSTRRPFKLPRGMRWYGGPGELAGERGGDLCDIDGPGWYHVSELAPPLGVEGDRLYVRETTIIAPPRWARRSECNCRDDEGRPRLVGYLATMGADAIRQARDYGLKATPSILMPRWAARNFLEITAWSAHPIQEMTLSDAIAEGFLPLPGLDPVRAFAEAWDSFYAGQGHAWHDNRWVNAYRFRLLEGGDRA